MHYGLPGIAGDLRRYFPDAAVDERAGEALRHLPLRRRQEIVRHYPDSKLNGRPVAFPETKLRNQNYDLEHDYRKAGGRRQIVSRLQKRQASRYRPGCYLTAAARDEPECRLMKSRTHSLSALMRAPPFKRLESGIPAFRSTPAALIDSSRAFRNGLLAGSVSRDDDRDDDADAVDALDAADQDQDALTIKGAAYDVADFRAGEWRDDLDVDRAALQAIYETSKI